MRHIIMTALIVILVLFILAGMVLTVYTWSHFKNRSEEDQTSNSLSAEAAAESPVLGLSAKRWEQIGGIPEAQAS